MDMNSYVKRTFEKHDVDMMIFHNGRWRPLTKTFLKNFQIQESTKRATFGMDRGAAKL